MNGSTCTDACALKLIAVELAIFPHRGVPADSLPRAVSTVCGRPYASSDGGRFLPQIPDRFVLSLIICVACFWF